MYLLASVFVPAIASADTGNTNTIKVLGAPTINPPATGSSFTVNVVANGSVDVSGAGAALSFDKAKLQLTNLAKDATIESVDGAGYVGFPTTAQKPGFISTANTTGYIPNISWVFPGGSNGAVAANVDRTIFTATFTVLATGDSTLLLDTTVSGVSMLDGQTTLVGVPPVPVAGPTYGNPLTVTPVNGVVHNSFQPIFTLTAPATATVLTGATSAGYTVSTSVTQGAPGAIAFSATGLPSGVTAAFTPTSVTGVGNESSTLTFTATAGAAVGTSTVTVTGTDASAVAHSQTISLSVVGNNDFGISASPANVSANGGGAASSPVTVSTSVITGTPGNITLSTSALPTGVTAAFSASPVAAGLTSSLTFTAGATALAGSTVVTISGTNGTYTKTATVNLNVIVTAAGDQSVNVTGTLDSGFLGLTCPTSMTIPLLRGNTNQLNVPCQVYTNTVWNLNVSDPKPTNTGHMTTTDPTPNVMPDSMHVLARSFISGGDTFYGNNVDLANGSGTSCTVLQQPCSPANTQAISGGTILTGTNSASAPLVVSQFVAASTRPGSYGIQVLFSAVSVF
jgi:hypothetical protein